MKINVCPTSEWPAADPVTLNMDAEKLSKLEHTIRSKYNNINGIVVVRSGHIAYEQYFNEYGPNDVHHVASVTKSICSALIGIAIEKGYIEHVDQKVVDFFPEYDTDNTNQLIGDITIRHLLTMTAPYSFQDWQEPLDKMCMQPDWVKYTLDILGQNGSIGAFKYSTGGAHLLSAILTRCTGRSARAFANEHLFKPIGMKEIQKYTMKSFGFDDLFGQSVKGWVEDPHGHSTGGWGLTLSPRDMARFGLLYLNRGKWNREQIISERWVDESTTMNVNHYGYMWWLQDEGGISAYLARGDGGNIICCIPQKELVVAIASAFSLNPKDRWTLIKDEIVPSLID